MLVLPHEQVCDGRSMRPPKDELALLAHLLSARCPLLLAGAGASSAVMGYPLWDDLVRQLTDEFAPRLPPSGDSVADVDRIASVAADAGRANEYFKWLDRKFCFDGAQRKDLRFHRQLISLGFSGLVTPNFDPTLEQACIAEYSCTAGVHNCEAVDLTDHNRRYLVFEFLRNIGASPQHNRVLHLHGLHSAPDRVILGTQEYVRAYGHDPSEGDAGLRTLPRKVIWTLLATRPVLFVGFSMTDPFFNATLRVLENDFVLTDEPAHFSTIPYDVDLTATEGVREPSVAHEEEKQRIREKLPRWLVPIFYHAPGLQDHTRLATLVDDLRARIPTATRPESPVERLARRTLEEL